MTMTRQPRNTDPSKPLTNAYRKKRPLSKAMVDANTARPSEQGEGEEREREIHSPTAILDLVPPSEFQVEIMTAITCHRIDDVH
jgi:hypothetical protein